MNGLAGRGMAQAVSHTSYQRRGIF